MSKKLASIQILGAIFIIIFGSFVHFAFEIFNHSKFIAAFVPVNESVWEHLKLGFLPLIFYYSLLKIIFKNKINNVLFALVSESLILPLFIVFSFYFYTFILGRDILIIDILIFVLAVLIAQYIGYKILLKRDIKSSFWKIFSGLILFLVFSIYFLFTFKPPRYFLFKDPITKTYGYYQNRY